MPKRKVEREIKVERKTKETEIACRLNIDGKGKTAIDTGIGFLDHMLELFSFHGLFDLILKVIKSDLGVDLHHTNEDAGIVLGQAFKKALGQMRGIRRFGFASVPMEDVLANVTVDISGRGYFRLKTGEGAIAPKLEEGYTFADAEHFFDGFAKHFGMNLNISIDSLSPDLHTTLEPIFKALGLALDQATQIDPRRRNIPSTKGIID